MTTTAQGRYHEVDALVADGSKAFVGKLQTMTNERDESVSFHIKSAGIEITAKVDDPVKLEAIGLSILAIARLHRK